MTEEISKKALAAYIPENPELTKAIQEKSDG